MAFANESRPSADITMAAHTATSNGTQWGEWTDVIATTALTSDQAGGPVAVFASWQCDITSNPADGRAEIRIASGNSALVGRDIDLSGGQKAGGDLIWAVDDPKTGDVYKLQARTHSLYAADEIKVAPGTGFKTQAGPADVEEESPLLQTTRRDPSPAA